MQSVHQAGQDRASSPAPAGGPSVANKKADLRVRPSFALALGALAVLAVALRLACFTGLIGSDDLQYAKYAQAFMDGRYGETLAESRTYERIHHGLRLAIVIPLAGLYSVFGVSEWSTIAMPLLASTASVLLLAVIGRRLFDTRVAIIAALLYATFPMHLRLGTILVPEPIAEFFILLGVLAYLHARDRGGGSWIASGALIGAAYLSKETAVFAGGALALHAFWERRWAGAALFSAGLACVIAGEHAYYFFGQGDVLLRPHSTQLYSLDSPNAPRLDPELAYWLLTDYPRKMLLPGLSFGLHSLACLVWAGAALALTPRRNYALVVLWAAVPWLYMNFGSWSLQQYAPLPRETRYIVFSYPPLMLLSGVLLSRALSARAWIARPMAAGLALVLLVGVMTGFAARGDTGRAHEMTVLREIVRAAQATPGQTIYTEDRKWHRALAIFDASLVSASPERATFILVRGPLDFPVVQRGPSAHVDSGSQ